jgi:autotransporter-associated beta strand protein
VVNSGAVQLGGAADNSYATANVKGGTLILAKLTAGAYRCLGGNSIVENGGTLILGSSGTGGDQIYAAVALTVQSGGVFDLNSMSETFTTLNLAGTGSGGGALINSNTAATSTLTANVVMTANSSLGGSGDLIIPSGKVISGTGFALTKVGTGTLTLSGANTYSGETIVSAGTLSISTGNTLANGAAVRVAASEATLNLTFTGDDVVDRFFIGAAEQASGTWGSLASAAAHKTALITGTGLLNVTNGATAANYTTWAATNGVTGGPNGDSDHDGISNLVEYALNLNFAGSDGAPGTLVEKNLTFKKRTEAVTNGDVSYVIETSTDLGLSDPWTPVTPTTHTTLEISYTFPNGPVKNFARFRTTVTP